MAAVPGGSQGSCLGPSKSSGRLRALIRFTAFVKVTAASLIGINVGLSRISVTANLLQEGQSGILSIPLLLPVDGTSVARQNEGDGAAKICRSPLRVFYIDTNQNILARACPKCSIHRTFRYLPSHCGGSRLAPATVSRRVRTNQRPSLIFSRAKTDSHIFRSTSVFSIARTQRRPAN